MYSSLIAGILSLIIFSIIFFNKDNIIESIIASIGLGVVIGFLSGVIISSATDADIKKVEYVRYLEKVDAEHYLAVKNVHYGKYYSNSYYQSYFYSYKENGAIRYDNININSIKVIYTNDTPKMVYYKNELVDSNDANWFFFTDYTVRKWETYDITFFVPSNSVEL